MIKVPLFSRVKDIFKSGSAAKRKKVYHNVRLDNPEENWEIIGELGDGAYGKVYKAQSKHSEKLAALKQVILEGDDDLESFMIEIDILAECKHPNIVELLEAYYFDGKLWMYLEYCDGGAVDSIMVDLDRGLTEDQVAYICKNLCKALIYIHSQKVIHRDLKAGNVLLTMEGGVKLADFGVSAKNKNTWEKRGTFIGTPYWLAPEVILCETFIDAKYDYKADIWSLGISLIEFAQMDPPNHEISPVRVMLKIQKSDPPKLDYPHKWSKEFNDFISKCLVKDPLHRPDAEELLKHPFLQKDVGLKPIRDLLLEYKAEVVEEEVDDESEDQDPSRISTIGNNGIYKQPESSDDRESVTSFEKDDGLTSNGDRLHIPTIDEGKESVFSIPTEKRISKGPAPPPPPVIISSSVSQQSPKKGPAPAVPSSTLSSNELISNSNLSSLEKKVVDVDVSTENTVTDSVSKTVSTTIPKIDVDFIEPSPAESVLKNKPIETEEAVQSSLCVQPEVPKDAEIKIDTLSSNDSKLVKESENDQHVVTTTCESKELVSLDVSSITVNHIELKNLEEVVSISKDELSNSRIERNTFVTENNTISTSSPLQDVSLCTVVTTDVSFTNYSKESIDFSSIPVPVTFNVLSAEKASEAISSFATLTPEPTDVLLASISSEGTVIVRTPTPTQSDISHLIPKRENIVTYTVAEEVEIPSPVEVETNLLRNAEQTDSFKNYSLQEAEAQAVHILETAIDSAMDESYKYSEENSGHSSPSSLTENSHLDNFNEETVRTIAIASEELMEQEASDDFAQKLDESEVLISNSSILHDENISAEKHSRYELTLEEASSDTNVCTEDETHISVVAVEEASRKSGEQNNKNVSEGKQMSLTIEGTTVEDTDVDNMDNISDLQTMECNTDFVANNLESTNDVTTEVSEVEVVDLAKTPANEDSANIPLKLIQNGIRRRNSRSSEISDTDTTSTVGSDKENQQRQDDSDASEDVTLRKPTKRTLLAPPLEDHNAAAKNLKNKELQESIALRKKTRKRTRKFVIDGVVFTTTTSKVIYGDDEECGTLSSAHLARKQELRELKLIQRQEQKQFQELGVKANLAKQEQERKFEIEKANLIRNYDSQIENLTRQQKQLVEKAEGRQEYELKIESKKVRVEQERELKAFRESLKQEWKLLKQESELLPKDRRKETYKIRKEQLERSQAEKEKAFVERLNDMHELTLKKLSEKHRRHIALKERQFLEEKHQLLRARESALWDMEERQIQDKHQLAKEQLKDIYFLQRYQMAIRHNVEQEQVKRLNLQKEETLLKRQQTERRQLPKRIRQEMKTREKMFREQIRISMTILPSHEEEKDQLKKFQEQEKVKYDKERKRAELKHKKQLEELQASTESSIRELVHLQNEKGKLLTEHETYKLKSLDEEYQKELKEWKANLAPRKQKLEEGFERQLTEQEKFYGEYLDRGLGLTVTPSESTSSLSKSNNS